MQEWKKLNKWEQEDLEFGEKSSQNKIKNYKSWIKSSERWIDEVLKVCKENSQSGIQEVQNIG